MRPFIADRLANRSKQQAKGLLVRGFNPVDGVRPKYREFGMLAQHKAPRYTQGGLAAETLPFQDLLLSLKHLENENTGIDKVSLHNVSEHVGVKFMWREPALNAVQVINPHTHTHTHTHTHPSTHPPTHTPLYNPLTLFTNLSSDKLLIIDCCRSGDRRFQRMGSPRPFADRPPPGAKLPCGASECW